MKKLISILSALFCGGLRGLAWNTVGTHPNGQIPRNAEEAISTRHLLVKQGSDADGVLIATAGAVPLGTIDDEADSTDVADGMPKNINLLGAGSSTRKMVAAGAIAANALVYSVGGGKVEDASAAATGDYRVGRAITAAAADGDIVEVVTELPTVQKS